MNDPTIEERFWPKVKVGDKTACWLWTACKDSGGYGVLHALGEHKAHRVSWKIHKGEIPTKTMVLHNCDVRNCVNPEHLWLGTQLDNMRDMAAKGRGRSPGCHGEDNPMSRLTAEEVKKMRKIREKGTPYHLIAAIFGVSTMTAYRAVVKQSWRTI